MRPMHNTIENLGPNLGWVVGFCRRYSPSCHRIEIYAAWIALARDFIEWWLEVAARVGRTCDIQTHAVRNTRHVIKRLRVEQRFSADVARRRLYVLQNARKARCTIRLNISFSIYDRCTSRWIAY